LRLMQCCANSFFLSQTKNEMFSLVLYQLQNSADTNSQNLSATILNILSPASWLFVQNVFLELRYESLRYNNHQKIQFLTLIVSPFWAEICVAEAWQSKFATFYCILSPFLSWNVSCWYTTIIKNFTYLL